MILHLHRHLFKLGLANRSIYDRSRDEELATLDAHVVVDVTAQR
jgi:hypothetical protein